MRKVQPVEHCKATKEGLLQSNLTLDVVDNCPICFEFGFLCFVANHPSRPYSVDFVVPAFEPDRELHGDFLLTPLPVTVPVGSFVCYQCEDMDTISFDRHISHAISRWMDGTYGEGEKGLISRNDALFGIYQHLANLGKFSRNKYEDSTVAKTRSDRTDNYEGVTLVRIEEHVDSIQETIDDLARTANWLPHYEHLPFIFGIAVTQDQLKVFTLHADNTMIEAFSVNYLTDIINRWSCVRAMINIARTLKSFIEQKLVSRSIRFDIWHERNNKRIRFGINFVEIEYYDYKLFVRMCTFYKATENAPNIERLYRGGLDDLGPFTYESRRVRLVPVGVARKPSTICELTLAIKHISMCLCSLHALGYVHCDVRWSSIVYALDQW